MANATETLKAHVEVGGWVFALGYLEKWRADNPDGTVDDYLTQVRQETAKAKARFVEVEVENGSTRESAERTAQLMH
jgi:hypothetical protein